MSVFWYPQHARPLPRSGRIPRSHYNYTDDTPPPQPLAIVEEVTDDDDACLKEGLIRGHGAYVMLCLSLTLACFGVGGLFLLFAPSYWYWTPLLTVLSVLIMVTGTTALAIPIHLSLRHRRMLRALGPEGARIGQLPPARSTIF